MEVRKILTSTVNIEMDHRIAQIYQSNKTVLTSKDLALLWGETHSERLKAQTAYYVKRGALKRLTRGIFAKDKQYEIKELANSLYTPSYISFETVLREAGINFQHYERIFVAAPWSVEKKIDGHTFVFRKLKDTILYNPRGIDNKRNYSIASPERAFLDTLYLMPNYHFDNLEGIRWDICFELVRIYDNKQLLKRLNTYHQDYAA